ncbi:MAG: GNAT family N-acetyltransferase [Clostridiales bacterium]|nr:GNAT family N-acetyltransferase [Clostridiales bacterium]
MIVKLEKEHLPECLDVIRKSFSTEVEKLGLNEQNCPDHIGFAKMEKLEYHLNCGVHMYGLYDNKQLIGHISLSEKENGVFDLYNLSILPEHRNNGYGTFMLNFAKVKVREMGGKKITVAIIEKNTILRDWYRVNGFVQRGTKRYEHLPYPVRYMEWKS